MYKCVMYITKLWGFTKGLLITTTNKIFIPSKCSLFQTTFCLFRQKIYLHHFPCAPPPPLPPYILIPAAEPDTSPTSSLSAHPPLQSQTLPSLHRRAATFPEPGGWVRTFQGLDHSQRVLIGLPLSPSQPPTVRSPTKSKVELPRPITFTY